MALKTFPSLARPVWLQVILWAVPALGLSVGILRMGYGVEVFLGSMALGIARFAVTREYPGNTFMASGLKTVKDVIKFIVRHDPAALRPKGKPWRPGEIREIVRRNIADRLGINDFSDDADLVKDLGLS